MLTSMVSPNVSFHVALRSPAALRLGPAELRASNFKIDVNKSQRANSCAAFDAYALKVVVCGCFVAKVV